MADFVEAVLHMYWLSCPMKEGGVLDHGSLQVTRVVAPSSTPPCVPPPAAYRRDVGALTVLGADTDIEGATEAEAGAGSGGAAPVDVKEEDGGDGGEPARKRTALGTGTD